jgi:ribonucleoside-triphosphate reductase
MLDVATLSVTTREGHQVPFNPARIRAAFSKCFATVGSPRNATIDQYVDRVVNLAMARYEHDEGIPLEGIQDLAEMVLQAGGEFDAAKHYILFREEHRKQRENRPIPDEVRKAFSASDSYFPTALQKFQFFDKYSRFNYEFGRRETWLETVDRVCDQLWELAQPYGGVDLETRQRIYAHISHMRAMPSMRLLSMAGPAFRRDNASQYNCTYLPADGPTAVKEAMLLSMAGCGVGFSVEKEYVEKWPKVKRQDGRARGLFVVEDTAEGWGAAVEFGLETWLDGGDVEFNTSLVRLRGAPLRIKGGRASGPEPLEKMLNYVTHHRRARHHVHGRKRRGIGWGQADGDDLAVRPRRPQHAVVQERRLRAGEQPAVERQQLGGVAVDG